jgi:hypothetical protein
VTGAMVIQLAPSDVIDAYSRKEKKTFVYVRHASSIITALLPLQIDLYSFICS